MKLTVTIDTDNAAFDGEYCAGEESARILRDLANKLDGYGTLVGRPAFLLRDANGNTVGSFVTSD